MTVTGTHNPSSVKICVIPALFPKTPTPPSTLANVCNRAPLEEEEEEDVVVDEVIKEERALNEEDLREAKAEAEVAANVWASADILLCVCVCFVCIYVLVRVSIKVYIYVRKMFQIEFFFAFLSAPTKN